MSISKRNPSGEYDLTAREAIMNITGECGNFKYPKMPLVFICSPFAGNVRNNIKKARRYARFAVETGNIPIVPHLLFPQFMNDGNLEERELAMHMGLSLMTKCIEVWQFGDFISPGMRLELKKARNRGIYIRKFTEDCKEVTQNG